MTDHWHTNLTKYYFYRRQARQWNKLSSEKNVCCSFIYRWMKCGDLHAGGIFVMERVMEITMIWKPANFSVEIVFYEKVWPSKLNLWWRLSIATLVFSFCVWALEQLHISLYLSFAAATCTSEIPANWILVLTANVLVWGNVALFHGTL